MEWGIVVCYPSPSPDTSSYLSSVAVVSANDIWAVGASSTGTLTEQWNGTAWNVVASPSPDSSSVLSGVAAVSASDIWAVGYTSSGALTENWNGTAWSVIASPNSGSLSSVVVISASDIWAVGTGYGVSKSKTLTEHWNGTSWAVVSSPNVRSSSFGDELYSVTAVSSNNVWAAGLNWTHDDFYDSVIENWNGTKWKVVSNLPRPSYSFSDLSGIASVPGTSHLWAVGFYSPGQKDHAVTEYYG